MKKIWNPEGFYESPVDIPNCGAPCQDIYELLVLKSAEEDFAQSFQKILAPHDASTIIDGAAAEKVKEYADSLVLGTNLALSSGFITVDRMAATKKVVVSIADWMRTNSSSIVVAHSQGNLLSNLAWATVASEIRQDIRKRARVINIANTSRFSVNGLNLTHDDDNVLSTLKVAPGAYNFSRSTPYCTGVCAFEITPPTFKAPFLFSCILASCKHWMNLTYLSTDNIPTKLVDQGVQFTQNANRFMDRFEDLVYAATSSLDIENGPKNPVAVFDNLGDRQYCTRYGGAVPSVSCSGEVIGLIPGFGPLFPPQPFSKAALAFDVPAGAGADLTSIELPLYSHGTNQVFLNVLRDANGVPDTSSPVVVSRLLTGQMTPLSSLFALPNFPTIVQAFDPGSVVLAGGTRYWVEVTAPAADTRATWPVRPTVEFGIVATSRSGNPYVAFAGVAQHPALRVVVTPR